MGLSINTVQQSFSKFDNNFQIIWINSMKSIQYTRNLILQDQNILINEGLLYNYNKFPFEYITYFEEQANKSYSQLIDVNFQTNKLKKIF
jgi:hypothetical protein